MYIDHSHLLCLMKYYRHMSLRSAYLINVRQIIMQFERISSQYVHSFSLCAAGCSLSIPEYCCYVCNMCH